MADASDPAVPKLNLDDAEAVRRLARELKLPEDELRRVATLLGCNVRLIRSYLS